MLGRVVAWPIRAVVRKLCKWKLIELRSYERALIALSRSPEKIPGDRLEALANMLKQLREEIAMIEHQYKREA